MKQAIKSRTKSKSHWFNTFVLAFGFINLNLPMLQDKIGDNYGYVFMVMGVIGIILREVTTKPVSEK